MTAVRSRLNRAGWDVVRHDPRPTSLGQTARLLREAGIAVVFDVGANTGQFGEALRAHGYRGRLVSFEPLEDAHASLLAKAETDADWEAVHLALGEREGEMVLHVAGNSQSSSFLEMLPAHRRAAPESSYVREERVKVGTLDRMVERYVEPGTRLFVKIDTQGYETQVLAGAERALDRIAGLLLELSLVPLYDGQALLESVVGDLRSAGFTLTWIEPVFWDRSSGQLLQVDGLFVRTP